MMLTSIGLVIVVIFSRLQLIRVRKQLELLQVRLDQLDARTKNFRR